jgi:hypothetical protein
MGPLLMGKSRAWFTGGLLFSALLLALLIINWAASNNGLQRTRR